MEENSRKKLLILLLPELGCMTLAALMIFALSYTGILEQAEDRMLCRMVLIVLGIGGIGFSVRTSFIRKTLDYDNGRHMARFWLSFLVSLCVAFLCVFLPAAAWPFLPVFVLFTLFSNLSTGVLAGAVLLAVPVCLADAGTEVYLLYMISGILGAVLFQGLKSGFKTALPLLLSLGCLLVCVTAGTVLTANARPGWEYFVVPIANLIISGILLFGILKYFFAKTIYMYRDRYLELNDTENSILTELRQKDKSAYLKNIHVAYFCEQIAMSLGFDAEALKCAAYYHGMGEIPAEEAGKYAFPPEAVRILEDYWDSGKPIRYKETAVLTASDHIISIVLSRMAEKTDKPIDYDREIDALFQRYYEKGMFNQCNIAVSELQAMKKIFKEKKMYYEFLH